MGIGKKPKKELLKVEDYAFAKLLSYATYQWPDYIISKHHAYIAKCLEAVETGDIERLIITIPPRYGKTVLASEYFSAWFLGRNPSKQIIFCTYSHDRAADIGRKVRNQLQSPQFKKVFPECKISRDTQSVSNVGTEAGGNFFAVGLGGPITGRGAHCLPGDTIIETEVGSMRLDKLLDSNECPMVLSLGDNGLEYNKIIASQSRYTDELYTIETSSGRKIRATGEHRFYIHGQGYTATKDICEGQKLVSLPQQQDMRNMWKGKDRTRSYVSSMLYGIKEKSCGRRMCVLRENFSKESLRCKEINKTWFQEFLLQRIVQKQKLLQKQSKQMYDLWRTDPSQNNENVLRRMSENSQKIKKKICIKNLSELRNPFYNINNFTKILHTKMCRFSAFIQDERKWECKLSTWKGISSRFQEKKKTSNTERQQSLCSMPKKTRIPRNTQKRWIATSDKKQFVGSPHRSRFEQQQVNKFDNTLQTMPYDSPQIESDTVSMVKRVCGKNEIVYDIQVEKTENFFANDILSHNCLIIDDPIKGQEEANSDLFKSKMQDWYQSTAYTRLMPGKSGIVVIQTRWSCDDLAGWLIKEHEDEEWYVLNLPAEAVEDDPLGREIGEPLWPEMYDAERLQRIKKAVGVQTWNSLFQGNPVGREGSIVKYEWLKYYDRPPEKFKRIVQSWDTAFKAKQLNDPSVCITFGETDNNFFVLDVFCQRLEYPDLRKAAISLFNLHSANTVIIEDKGSGQSLIQDLNRSTQMPIIPIKAELDKVTRLSSVTGTMEAGKFWLPKQASWLSDYVAELTSVPYSKHDDMADATSQYLRYAQKPKYVSGLNSRYWK